jgi:hypothetical protein
VVRSIQPGVLDQNIEAVEERPSGRAAAGIGLRGVSDSSLLPVYGALATRLSGKVTECTITEVIEPNERSGCGRLHGGTGPLGCGRATLVARETRQAASLRESSDEDRRAFFWRVEGRDRTVGRDR